MAKYLGASIHLAGDPLMITFLSTVAFLWCLGGCDAVIKFPILMGGNAAIFDYATSGPNFGSVDLQIGRFIKSKSLPSDTMMSVLRLSLVSLLPVALLIMGMENAIAFRSVEASGKSQLHSRLAVSFRGGSYLWR